MALTARITTVSLGDGLFAGAVVRIDSGAVTMTIDDPASFDPSAKEGCRCLWTSQWHAIGSNDAGRFNRGKGLF